jgi:hypothetical protein
MMGGQRLWSDNRKARHESVEEAIDSISFCIAPSFMILACITASRKVVCFTLMASSVGRSGVMVATACSETLFAKAR